MRDKIKKNIKALTKEQMKKNKESKVEGSN
jgi:hypothetical protein